MAQSPFLIDQLSVAPGEAGTRTVQRDAAAGALSFTDPVAATLLLSQLAGLQNIAGTLIVGKSGAGAQYTTLTTALAAVPITASRTNPYVILVMPGVYSEEIVLDVDGVVIFGLGYVEVAASADDNTLTIQAGAGTSPKWAQFHNVVFTNGYASKAAVRVIGAAASEVALYGVTFSNCGFEATAAGGGRPVWATSCGPLFFRNSSMPDNGLALCLFQEVMGFEFMATTLPALNYRYDTAQDIPAGTYLGAKVQDCWLGVDNTLNPVLDLDLDGGGSLGAFNLHVTGNTRISGDQAVSMSGEFDGDLSVLETATLALDEAPSGTVTVAAGAKYSPAFLQDTEALAAAATKAVAFGFNLGTADYDVVLELDGHPVNEDTPWVTLKLATGFTINFNSAQTLNVSWTIRRR